MKALRPEQAVGYIVLNDTAAARAAGKHRLLRLPHAEVVGLHWGMAEEELVQVGGSSGGYVGGRQVARGWYQ